MARMALQAEQATDPVAFHGEGPVWSPRWGGLRWVDMHAGDVLSLGADGTIGRRHVGAVAAVLRPRVGGGAVIGVERGFALEEPDGVLRPLESLWGPRTRRNDDVRMNEGGCDPDGRFYCGSMAYDQKPGGGTLYRLDPDGIVEIVLNGVTVSNGLEWSPDGTLAYYVDTASGAIDVFDYDRDSGLTGRRTFVEVPGDDGHPDGLTVDSQGGIWVALYGGSAVRHYSSSGELEEVISVPATNVTACTFGGADLDRLFITTSREGLDDGQEPLAGALFQVNPGVTGRPVREFAG
jgi:sugar lactone lactonase YvrE